MRRHTTSKVRPPQRCNGHTGDLLPLVPARHQACTLDTRTTQCFLTLELRMPPPLPTAVPFGLTHPLLLVSTPPSLATPSLHCPLIARDTGDSALHTKKAMQARAMLKRDHEIKKSINAFFRV